MWRVHRPWPAPRLQVCPDSTAAKGVAATESMSTKAIEIGGYRQKAQHSNPRSRFEQRGDVDPQCNKLRTTLLGFVCGRSA